MLWKDHSKKLFFTSIDYGELMPVFQKDKGTQVLQELKDYHALLLTGIASPQQMTHDLKPLISQLTPLSFSDHHVFSKKDVELINSTFAALPSPKLIITTEKDVTRLQLAEGLSDEDVVRYIQENPYVQYYLGLHEFRTEPLFDSSMMVHFRKRFPVEFIAKVNECICTGKWPEEMRNVDRNDDDHKGGGSGTQKEKDPEENPANVSNSGTLIIDATVADADIKYPTDIDLLNQCREHLEEAINLLWPFVSHDRHKYPYSQNKARKAFLNISKSKKWTKKKLYIGIGQQLDYIERATERLHQMQSIVTDWEDKLPGWLKDRLNVIPKVYLQQKEMHENGTHKSDDRIVSLQQPHIRPIVRGKRPEPTEFGQKLHLSVVDGYTFIEQTSWNNFNEGKDLPAAVENYRRRYGCYPKAVLADKLYQT